MFVKTDLYKLGKNVGQSDLYKIGKNVRQTDCTNVAKMFDKTDLYKLGKNFRQTDLYELGGKPAHQAVELPDPAVLVLLGHHRDDIVPPDHHTSTLSNTFNLDPNPEFWPPLDPDPYLELCYKF